MAQVPPPPQTPATTPPVVSGSIGDGGQGLDFGASLQAVDTASPPVDGGDSDRDALDADSPQPTTPAPGGPEPVVAPEAVDFSADEPDPVISPPLSAESEPPPVVPEPGAATRVLLIAPGGQFRLGGGPYTVPVSLASASQLTSISLSIFFDPNILSVRTVQEGSSLRQGGMQVTFAQQVDEAGGRIDTSATRIGDPNGAAGSGLLAAVLFEAIGVGTGTLTSSGVAQTPGGRLSPSSSTQAV